MKKIFLIVLIIVVSILVASYFSHFFPVQQKLPKEAPPLLVYTFDNLKQTRFEPTQITVGRKISETPGSLSQAFYYSVPKTPGSTVLEKVSGLLNIPKKPGIYPVIVMLRGFIPIEDYKIGMGSEVSAQVFAQNGFITLAPDFLGFGESDPGSKDGFENRFQTYTTALTLLSSLQTLNRGLEASYSGQIKADLKKVGIWGHSNGGHIALSVLEISGLPYPTVLWAPVSKSFPYSILYYTDESDDRGKNLRKALSIFEQDYDTDSFDPTRYYQLIKAPIEINQGTSDEEVPVWWSDELVKSLKKENADISYFTYPGASHNLLPNGWNLAVINSINFYNKYFAK